MTWEVDDGDERHMGADLFLRLEKMKRMLNETRICVRSVEKWYQIWTVCRSIQHRPYSILRSYLTLGSGSTSV